MDQSTLNAESRWSFSGDMAVGLPCSPRRHGRQALDSPAISTDDHLKFQGLDASAGAQLMEAGADGRQMGFSQQHWMFIAGPGDIRRLLAGRTFIVC